MTYRAAVIGCGNISRPHANAYRAVRDTDLVACVDLKEEARAAFATEFDVASAYADAAEMMADARPDIVSICTWAHTHPELTEIACARGARAIICEKPFAIDLQGADAMIDSATRNGAVLLINHQRRFASRFLEARRLIDSGVIGEVQRIRGHNAGDILEGGTHLVDILRYLARDVPVHTVMAGVDMSPYFMFLGDFARNGTFYGHHVESSIIGTLVFENGIRATLETGAFAPPGGMGVRVEGSAGDIEIDPEITVEAAAMRCRSGDGNWVEIGTDEPVSPFELSLRRLLDCLETGEKHPLCASSARADHEILMALYDSGRRRSAVTLPLETNKSPLEEMLVAGETPSNRPSVLGDFVALDGSDAAAAERIARELAAAFRSPAPGSSTQSFMQLGLDGRLPLTDGQLACLKVLETLWSGDRAHRE